MNVDSYITPDVSRWRDLVRETPTFAYWVEAAHKSGYCRLILGQPGAGSFREECVSRFSHPKVPSSRKARAKGFLEPRTVWREPLSHDHNLAWPWTLCKESSLHLQYRMFSGRFGHNFYRSNHRIIYPDAPFPLVVFMPGQKVKVSRARSSSTLEHHVSFKVGLIVQEARPSVL